MMGWVGVPAHPVMDTMITSLSHAKTQTQKARGLKGLIANNTGYEHNGFTDTFAQYAWMKCNSDVLEDYADNMSMGSLLATEAGIYSNGAQIMARPCPTVPRHGFVESRIVKTVGDVKQICKETLLADPRGELILMPFLESAKFSSVLTNQGLSIGSGHDGATSGKDAILIPCVSDIVSWIDNQLGDIKLTVNGQYRQLSRSRYIGYTKDPKRQPYLELVGSSIVQARYGPSAGVGATSYHPEGKTWAVFDDIWEPSMVLLADFSLFEQTIKEKVLTAKKCQRSLVLYLPTGTLSCHAAVQAICHGVAVVTGPNAPTPYKRVYFGARNAETYSIASVMIAAQEGFELGLKTELDTYKRSGGITWAAAVIQGMASVGTTPQSTKFLTAATVILLRAGLAACFAEHRHWRYFGSNGESQTPVGPVTKTLKSPLSSKHTPSSRSAYYQTTFKVGFLKDKTLYELLGKVQAIESDFNEKLWSSSIGGQAWGKCTLAVKQLLVAYMRFKTCAQSSKAVTYCTVKPDGMIREELLACVAECNSLLTVSHNNGKCLTKFVSKKILSGVTQAPGIYLMHPLTYEVLRATATIPNDDTQSNDTTETLS